MSCKGRRATARERIEPFEWHDDGGAYHSAFHEPGHHADQASPAAAAGPAVDVAALEREAFARGIAEGERISAGATAHTDAMLLRLTGTLDDLVRLRSEMIRKTERQVVELAMSVASRIVRREVSIDRELLIAMARVALDRLGDSASAKIRLHPEDYAAVERLGHQTLTAQGPVQVVADPSIARGGCVVESDFGIVDVSVDAQVEELTHSLLAGDDDSLEPVPVAALTAHAGHTR